MELIKHSANETTPFHVFLSLLDRVRDSRWRNKCKHLIKRTRRQLLIQKNRTEAIIRQSQTDIEQLLRHENHENSLARIEQLQKDQCLLSAYDKIQSLCDIVYNDLGTINNRSQLYGEVNEAVSSLVFLSSRCGELSELHRLRMLFRRRFGDEFDKINVELLPGNFVNSQIVQNLEINLIQDVELQFSRNTTRDYTISRESQHGGGRNIMTRSQKLHYLPEESSKPRKEVKTPDSGNADIKYENRKGPEKASNIKDVLWKFGMKFSKLSYDRPTSSHHDSSNDVTSQASVPLQKQHTRSAGFSNKPGSLGTNDVKCDGSSNVKRTNSQHLRVKGRHSCGEGIKRHGTMTRHSYSFDGIPSRSSHDPDRIIVDEESKPRLSFVHPKLPDYDDLVATFTEFKKDYVKSNSGNTARPKWMRW